MAMTPPNEPQVPDPQGVDVEPADLDGHTIEELSDYLERGQKPADATIDDSPGCQIALAAISRLRAVSRTFLESDARDEPDQGESWVSRILTNIGLDARAGRAIPVSHSAPTAHLTLTEGAVRGMIRAAGDTVDGVLIGRCHLDGDVTTPGEAVTIRVDASVFWGERMTQAAARVREAIYSALLKHTELSIAGIDVYIHDIYLSGTPLSGDVSDEIEKP